MASQSNQPRAIVADDRPDRRRHLRRAVLGEGFVCEAADEVSTTSLAARLAETDAALVLVYICGRSEDSLQAIEHARQVSAALIVACGDSEDAQAREAAQAAGCRHYIDEAILRARLAEIAAPLLDDPAEAQRGRIVSVYSPNGGIGVTTTAMNLAVRLAARRPGEVALLDLQPAPSDLSLLLDIEPTHTTADLGAAWLRIDRRLVEQAVTHHKSGLHVLPQAGYPSGGGQCDAEISVAAARQLLALFRRSYPTTIVDLDSSLSETNVEALQLSTSVVMLVRADVPGLHRARWAVETLEQLGVGRQRLQLVLRSSSGRGNVPTKKAEAILGSEVFRSIPDDRHRTLQAANRGIPLVERGGFSRIGRSFSALARGVQQ